MLWVLFTSSSSYYYYFYSKMFVVLLYLYMTPAFYLLSEMYVLYEISIQVLSLYFCSHVLMVDLCFLDSMLGFHFLVFLGTNVHAEIFTLSAKYLRNVVLDKCTPFRSLLCNSPVLVSRS